MQTTLTEKRFFEWHEDEVSVTLRNRSGSYGGGSEVLVICSTEIKNDAREVDHMSETIGVDLYNQCITGNVAKTLNAIKSDADHVPCVIVENKGGSVWCIGNGQVHDAVSPSIEVCKTLHCMDDPMKILIVRNEDGNSSEKTDPDRM